MSLQLDSAAKKEQILKAIDIENLQFSYPGQEKLHFDGINLEVKAGESFGLFGPNGAGKTTLMSLMTGLLKAKAGSIKLLGEPINKSGKAATRLFGFVPQDFSFYHELSPVENLAFFGAWAGLDKATIKARTETLLEVFDLANVKNKPVSQFSGGMKRRVNLAIGVIHQPQILFLDEPTVGVDVQSRHAIIGYLKQLNLAGTTLVYTSHQLNEAEELCKTAALIDGGKIIAHSELSDLLAHHQEDGLEGLFLNLTGRGVRD